MLLAHAASLSLKLKALSMLQFAASVHEVQPNAGCVHAL
jgi:hypothetical protein